ncbi:cysteine-rich receptor-like protein kinase 6 isoform X2 [Oryza glaberrima]|uniref:cysteine-rich receptor-like protein kinase 6 isoform X2 n=1 Tax=Oryza glaberrima TaxID=4538 RepID=UPI00224C1CFE|nr:cysteine-rich receptor-like protein kinase 6 isoform X2 [Oryza glaberrima]
MHGGGARALAAAFVLALLAAAPAASEVVCSGRRYAANSSFDASLQQVARTLPGNASSSPLLFATLAVAGEAYALALCQGGTSAGSCNFCVAQTMRDGEHACAGDADVAMYDDICTVRFSDRDFLAATTNSPEKLVVAGSQSQKLVPSAAGRFYRLVGELLDATADYAVANSTARFATGDVGVGGYFDGEPFSKIYALAQCTPDLTPAQCRACLASAMEEMTRQVFAASSPGGKVIGERCGLRFEVFSFYTVDAMVHLQVAMEGKKKSTPVLAIVLPIVFAGLLTIIIVSFYIWRKKRLPTKTPLIENTEDLEDFESIFIDLSTLQSATSNFDESNRLGEGGFGVVFKGVFPDGQEVAVKRLSNCSNQGLGQLKNELSLVAKLQHKNLVRLIGVCLEEGEKVLVYEYMPNKSLDTVLFDPEKSKQLDWGKRYNILYGIARGLQYLHEHSQLKIIHRDLKASNILLDSDMKPKIADFGMAKIFGDDQTRNATSRVVGTLGYMSPEYAMRGQYSTKLDVFSFGVLVLEIVTGRRNSYAVVSEHCEDLFSLVWRHWNEGTVTEIVDPSLGNHYPRGDILKCINIGLLCVQQNPVDRPPMSAIILMLSSGTVTLQAPYRPAYIFGRNRSYTETMDVPLPSGPHSSITELEPR